RVLCILGSGEQAQSLARTCAHALPHLERIQIWNRTVARGERFATETSRLLGVRVDLKDSPELAVSGADVVALTTPPGQPEIEADWLAPGALVITLTGVRSPSLLGAARVVVPTANRPNTLATPMRFQTSGRQPPPSEAPPRALAEVMLGQTPARDRPDRVLVFNLGGMYTWDPPIMEWAYAWASARGVGTEIDLD
ncbi:MAG: NAD(P)-binding domain-containing protein, partial [Chloroflexi bacterium]|nr:NAD(P)-binding domain-containing protein [Chloroflexota bacterium]